MPASPSTVSTPGAVFTPVTGSYPTGVATPGDWDPTLVTSATKFFWHDPTANDQITQTTPPSVNLWKCKFNTGFDVGQGVLGKMCTVDTSQFGGRQSMRFTSASSQEMTLTDSARVQAMFGATGLSAYVIYMVVQLLSVTGNHYLQFTGSSTTATPISGHLTAGALWQRQRRNDAAGITTRTQSGAVPALATPYVLRMAYDGTNAHWSVNGTELTTAGTDIAGVATFDKFIYGAAGGGAGASSGFLDGNMGDCLGFGPTISAADETLTLAYLHAKWGI